MRGNTGVCAKATGVSQGAAVSVICFSGCCIAEQHTIDLIRESCSDSEHLRNRDNDRYTESPLKAKCDPGGTFLLHSG